jgi:hypothetical protein
MPSLYTEKHEGCAIICGAAPCLFEDLAEAKKIRPNATVLGVKFAASLVPEIEHIWTQHGEMTIKIKKAAGRKIYVHARPRSFQSPSGTMWFVPHSKESYDSIDYAWENLHFCVGSSGVAGALWAKHGMGFDEVIMAGITLSQKDSKYVAGYPNKYLTGSDYATAAQIDNWLGILKGHVNAGRMSGVYSMSGSTSKILGTPC